MIEIKNPCPEKWENMSPETGGRSCEKCCKTVVDFSDFSDEEIVEYVKNKNGLRVCGRIQREKLFFKPKKRQAKFFAALLFVFSFGLFSCRGDNNGPGHVVGDVAISDSAAKAQRQQFTKDSADNAQKLKPETPFHLSKEDSTHVADSVAKHKNPIRDFD
ncbi:MAG: hypothetical protein HY064_05305 [Bacteroidetes bacterium]|nr:hypothetical protein [Bacteroidota bacterium]